MEEVLERELEILSKAASLDSQNAVSASKRPIDFYVVLNTHKLLKKNNIWNLLPKKEKYSEKRSKN